MNALRRDGDRARDTRSTMVQLDSLDHQLTAEARIDAAAAGLAKSILGQVDPTFATVSALTLLDAGLRDFRAARA